MAATATYQIWKFDSLPPSFSLPGDVGAFFTSPPEESGFGMKGSLDGNFDGDLL
jgi:hypothetical protein